MKVLHVTNAYPFSDYKSYGIFIKEQVLSLEKIGLNNNLIFINARKKGFKEYFRIIKKVKIALEKEKPDIIHCHHEFSILPLIIIHCRIPIVLSLLGNISERNLINRFLFKCIKHYPSRIIVKNESKKGFEYLPNGVDLSLFKEINKEASKKQIGLDPKYQYILFVSARLNNPIKQYEKFKSVVELLKKRNPKIKELIMSGVDREDVPFYYNSAEMMILCSKHEGSPNAIKEAMACNLPIVSTDVGNVKEMFSDTSGLYITKSDSVDDIFKKTVRALKDKKSNGRERIETLEIDMESIARKLKSIYTKILEI